MRTARALLTASTIVCLAVGGVAGCGGGSTKPSAGTTNPPAGTSPGASGAGQAPVPAETNPPGDIPDNQAYVVFRSDAGHFGVKVPEGWARADAASGVTFSDHLNSIQLTWQAAPTPPSEQRATAQDIPELKRTQLAFTLKKVSTVTLPGGTAVFVESQENSAPNSVTGKQYRLDVQRYIFFHSGQQAVLALSSPVGADNVDPWKLVSESFRWA
jgi:hypothetical protein